MSKVAFTRQEILKKLPIYKVIDDCLDQLVKEKGETYLPKPNPNDKSNDNTARYDAYLRRAVFYDVTSRTLNGLVGQAYSNDPEIKVPDLLKPLLKDANGRNVTLLQSSKEATEFVVSKGRCGLFIDYPKTAGPATRQQLIDGSISPTINIYSPGNVINWDVKKVGSKHILSLVVLLEIVQIRSADGFELRDQTQYRVLRLDEGGNYIQELYTPDPVPTGTPTPAQGNPALDKGGFASMGASGAASDGFSVSPDATFNVTDSTGAPFKVIPFTFIGAVNNDPGVDAAPLFNLAELNIGHYRNSADYEESCFIVGQPTYVVSGLTSDWLKNQLKGVINVGSRGGLPLPVGADAKILQPEPNTMPKEAMEHKEKQMVAIGAKLVENDKVQQTATAANIENTSETSILATACNNVSAAYTFALEIASQMVGATFTEETLIFKLNTDFAINRMSAQERTQLIAEWTGRAITFSEMRQKLRESAIATLDDKAAQAELDEAEIKQQDNAASAAKKLAEAVPPVTVGKPVIA